MQVDCSFFLFVCNVGPLWLGALDCSLCSLCLNPALVYTVVMLTLSFFSALLKFPVLLLADIVTIRTQTPQSKQF